MDPVLAATYEKLKAVREKEDLVLRASSLMVPSYKALDGTEKPFSLRYYQAQMVVHLLSMKRFLVGDDTGLGKCVTKDTLLDTNRGLVPIGDLQPGPMDPDSFASLEGSGVQVRIGSDMVLVKSFYYCGNKPTRRVRSRYGFEVEGSLVHPLFVRGITGEQFIKTGELEVGDYLCVDRTPTQFPDEEPPLRLPTVAPNAKVYSVPTQLNPSLARLLGYIVGEAWVNHPYVFTISQCPEKNPAVHRDIQGLLAEQFGWGKESDQKEMRIDSVYLRKYLEGMGVDYGLPADKRVPDPVMIGTRDSQVAFLRGLFEGEGSVVSGGVEISSASERLLREVQLLLLRLGIVSNRSPKMVQGRDHTYWRLTMFGEDARIFEAEVGFISSRKKSSLAGAIPNKSNPNHDIVPFAWGAVELLRSEILVGCKKHGFSISTRWGSSFYNTLTHVRARRRNPTYGFLEWMLEVAYEVGVAKDHPAYKGIEKLLSRRFFYDPIESIKTGFKEVVDIEVDDPRHCFVGNGLVNHNTLEVIAALCFLWEIEDPTRKVIIICNKSAVTQWALAFKNFTRVVDPVVSAGTPVKRKKAYKAWQEKDRYPVLVMGYGSVRRDFRQMQGWQDYILIADECFQYHTPVLLADGSTELIGKIVSQKLPVEVLSWNPETGEVEPKRVVDWHRVPFQRGRRRNLLHLGFRFGGRLRVTSTHKFYTPEGGKVLASRLKEGSKVQHLCSNVPSEDQWQVIFGALLGDSSLAYPNNVRVGVAFGHSEVQKDYLIFKREILKSLGVSEVDTSANGGFPRTDGQPKGYARFKLQTNEAVTSWAVQNRVWQGGKRITASWLNHVGPLGLAVWYADDGSLNEHVCKDGRTTRRVTLHTSGFDRGEVELLAGWLWWKWGVKAQIKVSKRGHLLLYLNDQATSVFLNLLPCGFPGVMYKFPEKTCARASDFDTRPQQRTILDWVTETGTWVPSDPKKDRYVYDLEVEGNHNFFANGTLVSNCQAFKNPSSQIHQIMRHLGGVERANRVWGMTATLIQNNLMEGFGIMKVLVPGLFTHSRNAFMNDYCIVQMQPIGRGRKVPVIRGYRPKDIARFKAKIDPFHLGRAKFQVAQDLPPLQIKEIRHGLTSFQAAKYAEALEGLLEVGDGELRETTHLTAITYCQEIVNHPCLIGFDEETSEKLDVLADLLAPGGELEGQKVIIYTRFKEMVNFGKPWLEKKLKVKSVRVTGDENTIAARQAAMDAFQAHDSGVNIVWITKAGSDSINLQAAKAIVFLDTPWSAGIYLQILGRMIRIGILHDMVYAIHLIARGTVDERTLGTCRKKLKLVEAILGKRIKGEGDEEEENEEIIEEINELREVFDGLVEDARAGGSDG